MRVGDLVKSDEERIGVVLGFDTYKTALFDGPLEDIVEVLWAGSDTGWILQSRLQIVC